MVLLFEKAMAPHSSTLAWKIQAAAAVLLFITLQIVCELDFPFEQIII